MANTITVRLFARLAELAGKRKLTLDLAKGMTAAGAFGAVARDYPKMAGLGGHLMYARNQEYVSPDTPLEPGDELALIPPVSGGSGPRRLRRGDLQVAHGAGMGKEER